MTRKEIFDQALLHYVKMLREADLVRDSIRMIYEIRHSGVGAIKSAESVGLYHAEEFNKHKASFESLMIQLGENL